MSYSNEELREMEKDICHSVDSLKVDIDQLVNLHSEEGKIILSEGIKEQILSLIDYLNVLSHVIE